MNGHSFPEYRFVPELWHFILAFGVLGGTSASLLFNPNITDIGHEHRP